MTTQYIRWPSNGSASLTLTVVGSSGNTKGASISGNALTLQPASASFPGVLTAADWTTFNSKQAALTLGNLSDSGTDGITITGGTGAVVGSGTSIAQHVADATHNGYLSSSDWTTFNGKQPAGTYVTSVSGSAPVVSSGGTTPAISMAASTNSVDGYLTAADHTTFSAKESALTFSTGLTRTVNTVTVNTSQNIATLSNLTTNGFVKTGGAAGTLSIDTSTYLTANQTITLSGDVSGSGTTAITATIGAGKVTNTMLAGSIDVTTKLTGTLAAAQFPALTGDITTSAGSLASTAAATQANIVTLSKSTGVAVHGTNTNDAAAAGYVGEEFYAEQTTLTNFPATNTYGDGASIALTAGDWVIRGMLYCFLNSATITETRMGISSTTGNSGTGLTFGTTAALTTYAGDTTQSVPYVKASITGNTTYYLKVRSTFSAGNPQYRCMIAARRER